MKALATRPRLRQALATWLVLYPLLTLLLWVFQAPLSTMPLPLRTFVLTVVLVPTLVFVLVPPVVKWLAPETPSNTPLSPSEK